jgi:hypothetical protein
MKFLFTKEFLSQREESLFKRKELRYNSVIKNTENLQMKNLNCIRSNNIQESYSMEYIDNINWAFVLFVHFKKNKLNAKEKKTRFHKSKFVIQSSFT